MKGGQKELAYPALFVYLLTMNDRVAESVDAGDLKSSGVTHGGSTPSAVTIPYYVLNLARRSDRRRFMEAKLHDAGVTDFQFVTGVDQRSMPREQRKYRNMRVGTCAPAIYTSFKQFLTVALQAGHPHVVYLEDDVYFHVDYAQRFQQYQADGVIAAHDVVYLGYQCIMRGHLRELLKSVQLGRVHELPKRFGYNLWGAYGIVFNRKALEYFDRVLKLGPNSRAVDRELLSVMHRDKLRYCLLHPVMVIPEVRDSDNMGKRTKNWYDKRTWDLAQYRLRDRFEEYIK